MPAEIVMRSRTTTTTGHVIVYVRYDLPADNTYARTAHWILNWATRPRHDGQPLREIITAPPE